MPPLIVFGFLLALLYERTGSILPGILLHMLNNIVALGEPVMLRLPVGFRAVIRRLALAVGAAALLAVPATAAAAPKPQVAPPKPEVPKATVTIDVGHLHGGKATILDTVPVTGTVKPFVPGQRVEVTFYLNGKQVVSRNGRRPAGARTKPGPSNRASSSRQAASTRSAPSTPRPRPWAPTRPCARAGRSASRS